MRRPALRFGLVFLAAIAVFSLLLQLPAAESRFVVPFTSLIAHASSFVLGFIGFQTRVDGTLLIGAEGFSVNILNGCNGVYVTAILVSAVMGFPSSLREKLVGLALGIPGVQVINLVRIVSLYYIGLRHPALFEQFHLYVWQTGVIVASMALWIYWAEVLVKSARPAAGAGGHPAGGA
ncbi:MAG TPA: exosortase H [Candidatus Polarisedimenticolia bacterium]|nr:exosortase H [Candidatus Polarisedimenticolia bacterium]